jgi:hypothetical protein
MASVYDAHVPRICRDRVWQGEDCTVNKPIDGFQGRPIVSQRAGRHYAEHLALHTAPSIPGGSKPWVRARRASLALLPQRPRHNERRTDAHVHYEPAQASPPIFSVLSPGFDSSIGHPLQLVEPFSKIRRLQCFPTQASCPPTVTVRDDVSHLSGSKNPLRAQVSHLVLTSHLGAGGAGTAQGLALGAYFVGWSLEVLRRLPQY